ncbi:transketolase C-terminal domain-containing protein [Robertmurraya massiliosenegalensis]|uniref:alpha-ketoacid dehydrogenase subunit beta n=1 Tax=Robertmurraya TaxID=2837507 RepID=UPI0039A6113A
MSRISYKDAVMVAIREEMERDSTICLIGIDAPSSLAGLDEGFKKEVGKDRIIHTPLSEQGFTGMAIGAAMAGLRPIVEYNGNTLQYAAMEQLVSQAGKGRYRSGGQINIPLVVRVVRTKDSMGVHENDNAYANLLQMGLKVIVPATPADAKGLVKQAIRDQDPVIIYEPALCYDMIDNVPDEEYTIPLGLAEIKHEGSDLTVVAVGHLVNTVFEIAKDLESKEISIEVIDPRTLFPLDVKAILQSVQKTGKLVIVDDGSRFCGFASEVAAIISETGFSYLKAPIKRITRAQIPVPYSRQLVKEVIPQREEIIKAISSLVNISDKL